MAEPGDKFRISELMTSILETINSIFEQNSITLPPRQYFAMGGTGETVHDCEQLTVSFEQIFPGIPGEQEMAPHKCASPRTGVFVVELVRCVPVPMTNPRTSTITLPTPEKQTLVANTQSIDAWLLLEAGLTVAQGQTLYGALADVSAGPISGQYQAMILNLTIGV